MCLQSCVSAFLKMCGRAGAEAAPACPPGRAGLDQPGALHHGPHLRRGGHAAVAGYVSAGELRMAHPPAACVPCRPGFLPASLPSWMHTRAPSLPPARFSRRWRPHVQGESDKLPGICCCARSASCALIHARCCTRQHPCRAQRAFFLPLPCLTGLECGMRVHVRACVCAPCPQVHRAVAGPHHQRGAHAAELGGRRAPRPHGAALPAHRQVHARAGPAGQEGEGAGGGGGRVG